MRSVRSADAGFSDGWRSLRVAAVVAAGVLLGMGVAVRIVHGDAFLPGCGFKSLTGIPCPGCGATHSLAFLAGGKFSLAISTNPLVSLLAASSLFAVPAIWLVLRFFGVDAIRSLSGLTRRRSFHLAMAVLIGANWVYLVVQG